MTNPIADLFVKAINFDALNKLSLDDLKKVNAIFDGAEDEPKSDPRKEDDDD